MIVSVIGFGHIGSVIGSVIASKKYHVYGIDRNRNLLNAFSKGISPISEPGLEKLVTNKIDSNYLELTESLNSIKKSEVIIITVGTPLGENNKADLSHLTETCIELEPHIKSGQLILVKSTIPPGTTKEIVYKTLSKNNKKIDVVFSPERLAEGNAINELKDLPIIVGGISSGASARACKFWRDALGVNTIEVNSTETSEFVKLANNAWIDLNIGLAHDLARLSDSLEYDIDIIEVINAANSLKKGTSNVNILTPSNGVGGYCLTKDPWFVYTLGSEKGIELGTIKSGRISNEMMPKHSANKIINFFNKRTNDLSEIKISVLGLSFKSNSGDIRFTPVLPFLDYMKEAGFQKFSYFDPLVTENDLKKINIKTNSNILDSIESADCLVFMTAHEKIKDLKITDIVSKCNRNALIFDGRRYFTRDQISDIKSNGLNYMGIGR